MRTFWLPIAVSRTNGEILPGNRLYETAAAANLTLGQTPKDRPEAPFLIVVPVMLPAPVSTPEPEPRYFVEIHTHQINGYWHQFYIEAFNDAGGPVPLEDADCFVINYSWDKEEHGPFDDAEEIDICEVDHHHGVNTALSNARAVVADHVRFLKMQPSHA